jgi:hypothetical protein
MGVLSDNRAQIVNGGLISASFVSDVYDVLTGNSYEDVSISGSLTITGSLIADLTGTASFALNSVSSSFSDTSSFYSGDSISTISGSMNYVVVSDTFITNGTVLMYTASLPTSDPAVNGQLWRSGSYLMISTASIS